LGFAFQTPVQFADVLMNARTAIYFDMTDEDLVGMWGRIWEGPAPAEFDLQAESEDMRPFTPTEVSVRAADVPQPLRARAPPAEEPRLGAFPAELGLEAALAQLNIENPAPALPLARRNRGLGFLSEEEVEVVHEKFCRLYFPRVPRATALALMAIAEKRLAELFPLIGTSEDLDTSGHVITLAAGRVEREIDLEVWLGWMLEGGDGSRGTVSWLRRYARTQLAVPSFRWLKRNQVETTFLAKYGLARSARCVAFDYADGVPGSMLNSTEHQVRARLRRVANARKAGDLVADEL